MIEVSVWIKRAWLIDLDAYWWLILLWIFTFNLIINYCIEWVREKWKRKKENLSTTSLFLKEIFQIFELFTNRFYIWKNSSISFSKPSKIVRRIFQLRPLDPGQSIFLLTFVIDTIPHRPQTVHPSSSSSIVLGQDLWTVQNRHR